LLPLACTSLSAQEDRSALIIDPPEQSRADAAHGNSPQSG
jgi:hypothetical protein